MKTDPFKIIRHLLRVLCFGLLVLFFNNCSGGFKIDKAGLDDSASLQSNKQTCSIGLVQNTKRVYRKNRQLIGNTINDVFGPDMAKAVESPLNSISPDSGYVKNFESFVNTVTNDQVVSYDSLAGAVAKQFISSDSKVKLLLGANCSVTTDYSSNSACFMSLKKKIIEPLYSKILSDAEMKTITSIYASVSGTSAEKLEETIYFVLQDPRFFYADSNDDKKFVTLRELARLIWYSVPDEKILAYSQNPVLSSQDISVLIEMMMADPKAERLVNAFFMQWLEIDQLKAFNYGKTFLESISSEGLRDAMAAEAKDFVRYIVIEKKGSLKDLFSSQMSLTNHPGLASIYGVSPAPGRQDLGENRKGILSRGAFLATGSVETKPILRGVHLTREILCNSIQSPPAEVVNMRFETGIDPTNLSTRQLNDARVAKNTCIGCHAVINPYGHGLGNYDGVGRFMMEDRQFNGQGGFAKAYPLDTSLTLLIDSSRKDVHIGHEFLDEIAESRQVAQCFDRQFYRFLAGQMETETQSCGWSQFTQRTYQETPILDVIRDVLKVEMGGKLAE